MYTLYWFIVGYVLEFIDLLSNDLSEEISYQLAIVSDTQLAYPRDSRPHEDGSCMV